ncbi:MAG: hypothetical protein ACYDEA_10445 [Candidatus Dormibacteria bacterium]
MAARLNFPALSMTDSSDQERELGRGAAGRLAPPGAGSAQNLAARRELTSCAEC